MSTEPFRADHDYHIHTRLSSCSKDPEQTPQAVLDYAVRNGYREICLTDHYWDETVPGASPWYRKQDTAHILQSLPLPQAEGVRFRFGCETEMRADFTLGIGEKMLEHLDFVIIPTTHLHMKNFTIEEGAGVERRAEAWVERFRALLNADLPFEKIGIAHLTCPLMANDPPGAHWEVLRLLEDSVLTELFTETAKKKMGVELNFNPDKIPPEEIDNALRVYRVAKACGCKFYFGSDAHTRKDLEGKKERCETIARLLSLTADDQYRIPG